MILFPEKVPTLESKDLIFSVIENSDLERYFKLCSNDKVMRPWGTKGHETKNETRALIDFLRKAFSTQEMIRWGIREKSTDLFIGDIGYWRFIKPRDRAEIGAKIFPEYWNRGYMTQAMICIMDYGFTEMKINSIEGNIEPENIGSLRLVEKLMFEREGYLRENSFCYYRQKYIDTFLMSMTASRWKRVYKDLKE